jgi:hypothetical protein
VGNLLLAERVLQLLVDLRHPPRQPRVRHGPRVGRDLERAGAVRLARLRRAHVREQHGGQLLAALLQLRHHLGGLVRRHEPEHDELVVVQSQRLENTRHLRLLGEQKHL